METKEETGPLISGEALGNINRDNTEDDQAFLSKTIKLLRQMTTSQLLKDDPMITWKLVKANVLYNMSVCLTYLVTLVCLFYFLAAECSPSVGHENLSVSPPITVTILSVNTSQGNFFLPPTLFISLHFMIFNIGGRATASLAPLP